MLHRTFDLSPPRADPKGKGKGDDVEVEQVRENVAADAGGDEGRKDGAETEVESSEATPRHTIYTKRPPGSGGGGTSGTRQSPEFRTVQGGSWDTYNSACDDLPCWNLTQGSRMNDTGNCSEFFSLSLPPAKRMFQKRRHRMDLLDDHIHAGVNFYATSQEIERASHQKRESEYLQRIAKLQQLVDERYAEVRASEIIAEEANTDSKWLLAHGVPLIADRIVMSEELAKYMFELGEATYDHGRKDGYGEGSAAADAKEALSHFDLYKTDCAARYADKRQEFEFLEFAIVKAVGKLSRKPDGVELLKKALGDQDPEAGGARPSHQD
ncbi:hypothetical protein HanOQP8_Chr17g0676461 [Helianthus annuus]|nr:hypothetical protein HanOQP8_Chr17g0676461 [Helianthus annuus]